MEPNVCRVESCDHTMVHRTEHLYLIYKAQYHKSANRTDGLKDEKGREDRKRKSKEQSKKVEEKQWNEGSEE